MHTALFGILRFEPHRHVLEDEMAHVARTLGVPQAEICIDGNFALGLQRNVVDPRGQAAGIAVTERSWVAVGGEIENRDELLDSLRERGADPPRVTDAELVAAAFDADGADCARALRGYFHAAIWDRSRRELVLIADRCAAVKAIYYCRHGDGIVFGSSLKAVAAWPGVPRALDLTALEDVLVLRHPLSPRTMMEGVSVLEAGTLLEVRGQNTSIRRYWRRDPWRANGADAASLERLYLDALQRAVARCAGSGEVGVMLSGGVDSAAILALLRRSGHSRIKTFSVHIGDDEASDRRGSRALAELFATEHRALDDLDERCLDALPEMVWHHESPTVDIHPTYALGHILRQECDVVLGGYGNDVAWGGMPLHPLAGVWMRRLWPAVNELHYLHVRRRIGRRALLRLHPLAPRTDVGLLGRLARSRGANGDALADFIAIDETLFGDQVICRELGKILVDAHGVWPRLPYAAAEVADLVEAVPPKLRQRRNGDGRTELKSFFKDAIYRQGLLPPEIIYRRKTWMHSPTAQWLRGPLSELVETLLMSRRMRARGLFDHGEIARLLDAHRAGRGDHSFVLMMLVAVELWCRLFLDAPGPTARQATLADHAREDRP
jgi:asparagine synthase (glutamine-hydrolysing)